MDFIKAKEKFNFLVYIVESPSSIDLYNKQSEMDILSKNLTLSNIPSISRITISLKEFTTALTIDLLNYIEQYPTLPPIIHISAHGNEDGIQLTSGELITWNSLREIITPISKVLDGLFICLSSCEGYGSSKMAMIENKEDVPFTLIVCNFDNITWSETAIGFSSFYHLLSQGFDIKECVEGMRYASGHYGFTIIDGEKIQRDCLNYIKELRNKNNE
jgi:hypothetical protein